MFVFVLLHSGKGGCVRSAPVSVSPWIGLWLISSNRSIEKRGWIKSS